MTRSQHQSLPLPLLLEERCSSAGGGGIGSVPMATLRSDLTGVTSLWGHWTRLDRKWRRCEGALQKKRNLPPWGHGSG